MFKTEYKKSMTIKRKCKRVSTNISSPIREKMRLIATAKVQRAAAAVVAPATYVVDPHKETIKVKGQMERDAGFLNGGEWLKVESKNPIWTLGMSHCRGVIIKNTINGKAVVGHVMGHGATESVDQQINGMFRYLREGTKRKDYKNAGSIVIDIFPGGAGGETTQLIRNAVGIMADLNGKITINEIGRTADKKDGFLFDSVTDKIYRFITDKTTIDGLTGTEVSEH